LKKSKKAAHRFDASESAAPIEQDEQEASPDVDALVNSNEYYRFVVILHELRKIGYSWYSNLRKSITSRAGLIFNAS
jgi:hypothetical protein